MFYNLFVDSAGKPIYPLTQSPLTYNNTVYPKRYEGYMNTDNNKKNNMNMSININWNKTNVISVQAVNLGGHISDTVSISRYLGAFEISLYTDVKNVCKSTKYIRYDANVLKSATVENWLIIVFSQKIIDPSILEKNKIRKIFIN
jgi:hypothetical protein